MALKDIKTGYIATLVITALITFRVYQLTPDPAPTMFICVGVMGFIVWMGFKDTKAKSAAKLEA